MTEHRADDSSAELITGMATGSDAGAPGDHLPPQPLTEDERALLSELKDSDDPDAVQPVEDSPEVERAAEDDGPLPVAPPADDSDDPDSARFSAGPTA